MSEPLLSARGIRKSFPTPGGLLHVLCGVDLDVEEGQILAILGASGVGKSTLLHILGILDRPSGGSLFLAGAELSGRSESERAAFRNRHIGFVFQFHHLLPEFTALENVMMPGLIGRESSKEVRSRARGLLDAVGLSDREAHKPHELSGGEQQRVAVARSLIRNPRLVLADEPSGNLDPGTAERLHQLVYTLARDRGQTWVIATHNQTLAQIADNRSMLVEGRLIGETGDHPRKSGSRSRGRTRA